MKLKRGLILVVAGTILGPARLPAETWDGPKLKPVARQEVFEFARPPTFRKVGPDRYEISFASRGFCDVAVAIEDAAGNVLNHLVYGVLGPNAPEPLKPDSLEQTLLWNAKDDNDVYVKEPEACRARVSLGLNPTFDRIIGRHPKDTIGKINALGADADGVYVLTVGGYWWGLRKFDHDGHYVKTLLPFSADRIPEFEKAGVPMTQVPGGIDPRDPKPFDGNTAPCRERYGTITPWGNGKTNYQILAVNQGRILWTTEGGLVPKQIMRIGADGGPTVGPGGRSDKPNGPYVGVSNGFAGPSEMAASPDGRWLYFTRLQIGHHERPAIQHAVFRKPYDDEQPINLRTNVFVGEAVKADNDNDHLNGPCGVATDAAGLVYVSDTGNNRIQVFSPDGKYQQTIACDRPRQIQVHQKTGEIYVMSASPDFRDFKLVKFSALPAGQPVAWTDFGKELRSGTEHNLGDFKSGWGFHWEVVMALDSWSTPPKVWTVPAAGRLVALADRGDRFEIAHDFDKDIRDAGYTPHAFNCYKMNRVQADPVRGHLYYLNSLALPLLRCDPEVGQAWDRVTIDANGWGSCDEMTIGRDGMLYMRSTTHLARFNPDKFVRTSDPNARGGVNIIMPLSSEVPFDYGEVQNVGWGGRGPYLQGALKLPAQVRGNGFDQGLGVSPRGEVMVVCQNYQKLADRFESSGTTIPPLLEDRYRPAMFPGRRWSDAGLIWVWSPKGEVVGEDLVQAMHGASDSVRGDKHGNIYVALAAHPLDADGKLLLPRNDVAHAGAVLKFTRAGGKVYGTWGAPVALEPLPDRPPEFEVGARLWTKGLLWSYPGKSTMTCSTNICTCPQSRIDVDVYGRVFVPESWRFSVGVCDTNGNPVMHIGRYGNPESGAGKETRIPVPGEIAFSQCDYVGVVSDKWLYVNDTGNWRIVRLKLGYHSEKTVLLGP